MKNIWQCKIGETDKDLPPGPDYPMRQAISEAYFKLTGERPHFIFSGWGAELTSAQRAVVDTQPPIDPLKATIHIGRKPRT